MPDSSQSSTKTVLALALTREEAAWLEAAARRASEDTLVPGAAELLRTLADKLRWPHAL